MSIKMNSKSLLTVLFVGSLCGLTNYVNASQDDFNEEEGSRLQITGATAQILAAISDSDGTLQDNGVAAGTVIVGGTTYTAGTNDLTSISLGLSAVEGASFAASASLAALAGLDNTAGTALTPGATYTTGTNDLTSLSLALSTMEGTTGSGGGSFTMALASLFVISRQTALAQVIAAASHPAIATNATAGAGTFADFNTTLADLRAAIIAATAVGGQTNTLVDAITTTANLAFTSAATQGITAPYTQASCQAALQALSLASINWSAFYSA